MPHQNKELKLGGGMLAIQFTRQIFFLHDTLNNWNSMRLSVTVVISL